MQVQFFLVLDRLFPNWKETDTFNPNLSMHTGCIGKNHNTNLYYKIPNLNLNKKPNEKCERSTTRWQATYKMTFYIIKTKTQVCRIQRL